MQSAVILRSVQTPFRCVPCESDRTQSRELPAEPRTPRRPPRRARGGYRHPDERNDLLTTRDRNSSDGRERPSPPLRPHLKVYRDECERIRHRSNVFSSLMSRTCIALCVTNDLVRSVDLQVASAKVSFTEEIRRIRQIET